MGKRILNLYVDDESIQIAKARNINMSALFNQILRAEITIDLKNKSKDDEIRELKLLNAKLATELQDTKTKLKKIEDRPKTRVLKVM